MTETKPPTRIRVAGKVYRLHPIERNGLGSDRDGEAIHRDLTITYDVDMAPPQRHDTVLHEVLHCCEQAAGLDLKEREVHALASQLYGVLRDNPQLVKWITS